MKYWVLKNGKKIVATTLMAAQKIAQQEADRIGRAVMVYGDDLTKTVKKGVAKDKVYARNPVKVTGLMAYNAGKAAKRAGRGKHSCKLKGEDAQRNWLKGWHSI